MLGDGADEPMARINVFEGSRRIALLLKLVWVIGVASVSYVESVPIHTALLFAIGGWITLSALQTAIGWIVRGFMGIPFGHDYARDSR